MVWEATVDHLAIPDSALRVLAAVGYSVRLQSGGYSVGGYGVGGYSGPASDSGFGPQGTRSGRLQCEGSDWWTQDAADW